MDSSLGYDRLAASYHVVEWLVFGKQLQHARMALLDQLPVWHRLIILGDGDGRLLEELFHRRGGVNGSTPQRPASSLDRPWTITSVDYSLAMLQKQQLRLAAMASRWVGPGAPNGAVQFMPIDARSYTPEAEAFDVLVTPFFLDCFGQAELAERLPIWLSCLRDGGMYLQVDFILPKSVWQRPRARLLLWAMHAFFRWQTGLTNRRLVDPRPIIEWCGLRLVAEQISGHGMISAQLWQLDSKLIEPLAGISPTHPF